MMNGRQIPIHMVTLSNPETAKDIYSLTNLFYLKIKVEAYKTTGPAQCYACQNFGHSSQQCGHPARCVKRGGDHPTKSRSKPLEDKPKCCNCQDEHPANYRGCLFYVELVKQKNENTRNPETRNKNQPTPKIANYTAPPANNKNASYAEITREPNPPEGKIQYDPSIPINKLVKIIHNLLSSIKDCTDTKAKHLVIKTALSIIAEFAESQDE